MDESNSSNEDEGVASKGDSGSPEAQFRGNQDILSSEENKFGGLSEEDDEAIVVGRQKRGGLMLGQPRSNRVLQE